MRYVHRCPDCQLSTTVTAREARQSLRCEGCNTPFIVPTRARAKLLAGRDGGADTRDGTANSGAAVVGLVVGVAVLLVAVGVAGAVRLLAPAKDDGAGAEPAAAPPPAPVAVAVAVPANAPVPGERRPAPATPEPVRPEPAPAVPEGTDVPRREPTPPGGPIVRPAAKPAAITPTKAVDGAEVRLPGLADAACLGGGGRYVVLTIPKVKQAAVLDVCEGAVVKYLPLPEPGTLVAAGNGHAFFVEPVAGEVQRWSLTTFEKEATARSPFGTGSTLALMGHATDGPLYVSGPGSDGVGFLDTATLRAVDVMGRGGEAWQFRSYSRRRAYRVSADGRVYSCWSPSTTPSGLASLVLGNGPFKAYSEHRSVGAILPGPDGTLFTADGGVYTPELEPIGPRESPFGCPVPAAHGQLYLTVTLPDPYAKVRREPAVTLRTFGDDRPLVELGTPAGLDVPEIPWAYDVRLKFTDRVFLVPDANALVILTGDRDRVVFHRLDLEARLARAGTDYLFVASRPPAAVPGAVFTYRPEVKSKRGGAAVRLGAGQDGMTVAADGTVTWRVPDDFTGGGTVILSISDASGRETFHTFTLRTGR